MLMNKGNAGLAVIIYMYVYVYNAMEEKGGTKAVSVCVGRGVHEGGVQEGRMGEREGWGALTSDPQSRRLGQTLGVCRGRQCVWVGGARISLFSLSRSL